MANENIEIQQPNFCFGPQVGTMCTIDTTNVNTVLRVKSTSGGTIVDYSFTSNIINELLGVEYIGPTNLSGMVDDLTFFTVERINSSNCIIKRWETQTIFNQMYLKEQIVKYSIGNNYYDANSFAIEYYNRVFTSANAGASGPVGLAQYLEMDSVFGIKLGTRLFLGPSTDPDNFGATEVVHVSSVVMYAGGYRVYLTSPVQNQYKIGDQISLYLYLYLYSKQAYGGSYDSGTDYKFDAYSWNKIEADSKDIYKRVTTARWCPMVRGVASVVGSNMLFIRPYESYSNWRSLFLKNYSANNTDSYEVYDVIFKDYSVYKLQDKTTLRDDEGNKQTFTWDAYNYQEDTLLPYSDSINMWIDRSILIGYLQYEAINIQVRDQYNVSLRDVNVNLYIEPGDIGASFDPLSGYGVTDINGRLTIYYSSGSSYEGHTLINGKADKSSTSTGSEFVWNSNNFVSKLYYDEDISLSTKTSIASSNSLKQIGLWYEDYREWKRNLSLLPDGKSSPDWFKPDVWVVQKSFFTTPGGDWVDINSGLGIELEVLEEWLPGLYKSGNQLDAPKKDEGCTFPFENWDFDNGYCNHESDPYPICNQIKVVEEFVSEGKLNQLTDFLIYEWVEEIIDGIPTMVLRGIPPYTIITLPDEAGNLQISQLKLSKHTYYVDGQPHDYLWIYSNIDQFIFVEDAVPKFWSEKNPIITNIWIRLRPFVFSLDNNTLRMWVKEVSYMGDTGYYEVTDQLTLTNFDAGGGALGIEVLYDPIEDFHHAAVIFVRIEVYDIAPIPNFVSVDYFFNVIPDFKSPYLTNLSPGREEDYVGINTEVSFEIRDAGAGVDLETLQCFINSIKIDDSDLFIEEYDRWYCKVTYTPSKDLYYGKTYRMTVKVSDSSDNENKLNDAWSFYTVDSDGVVFVDFDPIRCKRGVSRFSDVSVIALADGGGIDKDSIKLQVWDKDVDISKVPVVYRVS